MRSLLFALLLVGLAFAQSRDTVVDAVYTVPPPYPEWAHHHLVWLQHGHGNQTNLMDFVSTFESNQIYVGAVNIDSEWQQHYNDWQWDPSKYPNPAALSKWLHDKKIRITVWMTSVINTNSPTYDYAKKHNFFLNDGAEIKWWHGIGSFLDYSNEKATEWWHRQMDPVMDLVDGFKCDGTDPQVMELIVPVGQAGNIMPRMYSERYYRDTYYYARSRNPDALIMSRPVDSFQAIAYYMFSPRDTVFLGWVGDQDGNWYGIKDALMNMFHSSRYSYVSYGCDIAGYNGHDRTKELFVRWAQLGACIPVMENGGNGKHGPWMYDAETTRIYQSFVGIHQQIVPYLHTQGALAWEQGKSIIKPLHPESASFVDYWDYQLGEDMLISPIVDELNPTIANVRFPGGNKTLWASWWNPTECFPGGQRIRYECPMYQFPIYQRKGSAIPLRGACSEHIPSDGLACMTVGPEFAAQTGFEHTDAITFLVAMHEGEPIESVYRSPKQGLKGLRLTITPLQNGDHEASISAYDAHVFLRLRGGCGANAAPREILAQDASGVRAAPRAMQLGYNGEEPDFEAGGLWWAVDNKQGDVLVSLGKPTAGMKLRLQY